MPKTIVSMMERPSRKYSHIVVSEVGKKRERERQRERGSERLEGFGDRGGHPDRTIMSPFCESQPKWQCRPLTEIPTL
jgi:hypothetical protein